MRVLEFGELDELRARHGTLRAIEPLPEANLTNPSVVVTPHRQARVSGEGAGLNVTVNQGGAQ
jgi:anaerobic dimethyl sulfoxide reductase subunit B (iron-sulfur subunit)